MFKKIVLALSCFLSTGSFANKIPVYLIHGAHFQASGWQLLEKHLKEKKLQVSSLDLPGRKGSEKVTLDQSSEYLCENLKQKSFLVVHSQGGAVANHALSKCPAKVSGIVYVAAVGSLKGEKPFDQLSAEDEKYYNAAIKYDELTDRI